MVALGGEIAHPMTDGYLVTSIIYPNYELAIRKISSRFTGDPGCRISPG